MFPYKNETLDAPLQVDLNVTNRCNLSCKYCYSSANERVKKQTEIKLEEIASLFKELSEMGVLKVLLSGGEPLLRDDSEKILLLTGRFPFATILSTNGTLITKEIAKIIKKSNISLVTVSLEGATPKVHNMVRSSSFSFERTLRGIKILRSEKIPFVIGTTLNSINITHIFEMIDFVANLEAKLFAIQIICPVGRAIKNLNIIPNYEDSESFFLKLTDFKKDGKLPIKVKVNVTNESPVFWEYYYPLIKNGRVDDLIKIWGADLNFKTSNQVSCVAGRTVCSIDANGDVFPCEMFLGEASMVVGNIKKTKFKQIWQSAPLLKEFRNLTKDKLDKPCKNCVYKWCGGGCRAAALFLTGSIKGADKHCFYANKR